MTPLNIWRLFDTSILRVSARSITSAVSDVKIQQPHIYKKMYTEDQLIQYFVDNVVYESGDYIVTSVPQGVKFLDTNRWMDCKSKIVCKSSLQDLLPKLREAFNLEHIFITKHPRRNSSGMVILSKNFASFSFLRSNFRKATEDLKRIYYYLGVVMGHPEMTFLKTYKIGQGGSEENLCTEILEDGCPQSKKTRKTKYGHTVIDTTKDFSLVHISVSYDLRDCVRHILARKCFTPVFGDLWNIERTVKFLFGAPVKNSVDMKPEPYKLSSDILERIQITEDEQHFIPIHLHLYGLKLSLRNWDEFFVSVPPPETFIWTCRQLGLNRIEEFANVSPIKKR